MDVTISGRRVEVTEVMQKHIRDNVERLPRFDNKVHAVSVTLNREPGVEEVEVVAKCHKSVLVANGRSHDMYRSIDEAFEKLERQVARLHGKLTSRHKAQHTAELDKEGGQQ